jgi:type VI secretion system protein ImpF
MALSAGIQQELWPPLFDRLLVGDDDIPRTVSVSDFKELVRRDLEWLLNTHYFGQRSGDEAKRPTILTFGLPDLSPFSARSRSDHQRVARLIEETIRAFDPRLSSVRVEPMPTSSGDTVVSFRIDAILRVDPIRDEVFFTTRVEPLNPKVEVETS